MDRPLGPRTQPDKRSAAYESIFGRPTATHHQQPSLPPSSQYYYPANGQTYAYQHYGGAQLDRRTSYNSMHPAYTQQQTYRQPAYPAYYQGAQGSLTPPHVVGRARSVGHTTGVIHPAPEEPPDPGLEALQQSGLTPAQAYQAQVYMNSPAYQQQQTSHSQQNAPVYSIPEGQPSFQHSDPNLPRLGVNIDANGGRLDIDFGGVAPADDHRQSALQWPEQQYPPRSQPNGPRSRLSGSSSIGPIAEGVSTYYPQPASRPYPLQVDTQSAQSGSVLSVSPASSSLVDIPSGPDATSVTTNSRRSSESSKTVPGPQALVKRDRAAQDRARSFSATIPPQVRAMLEQTARQSGRSSIPSHRDSARPHQPRRGPLVYPALLSRVAQAFKDRIQLCDRVKDGLTYHNVFDGREAVDTIAYIIKTTDRNLALLYGRALDAQKFFHAVTYDHRLRDSANDLYQFRTAVPSPFVSGELASPTQDEEGADKESPTASAESESDRKESPSRPSSPSPPDSVKTQGGVGHQRNESLSDDVPLPSGVFTLLTDCYSPTCSRDQLCYSIACPRRLEQQARLNMKPQPGLKRQISKESLGEVVETGTLWIHMVPQEVVNSVSDSEKKRQEAINEVIYTERDFVRDMEYLRDVWIKPLKESDIIPEQRRTDFLEQVFWNIHDIIAVNIRVRDALNKRQKSYAVVEQIGDIFLEMVPHFGPFVSYGAHQLYGKYEFEKEKSSNPAFARFVEETERRPESRKLELNGYLTKPTTRLARYPLLLEAVLKHTPAENPDKVAIPRVVEMVREFLKAVNAETGKAENRFNLLQLDQQLVFRSGEQNNLHLREEGRELVYKGALKKRGNTQSESAEIQVFLFDHALLMVKPKTKTEQYKVYRRPIPLELLFIIAPDEFPQSNSQNKSKQKALLKNLPYAPVINLKEGKGGFSITFVHLGRNFYHQTLWASTYVSQRKWVEHITKQQEIIRERSMIFETVTLSEGFFVNPVKVNCAAPFNQGRRIVYGTDDGVYLSNVYEQNRDPVKVLALKEVSQVDVLEDYQLLIVLAERQVITFPLDALDPMDPMSGLKRAKRIASHISFFKAGVCLGKTLVCVVKASPLSSTIKTLEPIDQNIRGRSKPTFRKLLQGGNDTLKLFKEFYIPVQSSSVHFLKTKLCVGCTNGFEIVDLETLDTQGLLDPADNRLEFVRRKENLKPLAIYRIDNEFLLCYDEFAFYVNKTGWKSRDKFMIEWRGSPTAFALNYPYVLAFEPYFVEIRHVETGSLAQIIQGNNLRCLFADTPPSTTNSASQLQYNPYTHSVPNPYQVQMPSPTPSISSRHSLQNGYVSPYANPVYPRPTHSFGRDEIVISSDDRVMRLQLTASALQMQMQ